MPKEHLEPVMDGMRFASTMVVLNPRQSDQLQVPLGEPAVPLSPHSARGTEADMCLCT